MTTLTKSTPESTAAITSLAIGQVRWALGHAIKTFEAVPDDKLDFKPSDTAKSPREQMEHMIEGNGYVSGAFGLPEFPKDQPTDRAALIERLRSTTEAIIGKMEAVTPEQMDGMVDFFGPMPMPVFLMVNFWHLSRHAGQIDYTQTIWGDMQDYFIG